ncbi:MAG: heavy-metal-associated domain-containing protein [Rhodothermales bacterium]|nr:heavy-metal-associated domain-containing protein [Rhodothermales bacterium]
MKYELTISGMSCGHCVRAVEQALAGLDGVQVDSVDMGLAVVDAPADSAVRDRLKTAVHEEGYEVLKIS